MRGHKGENFFDDGFLFMSRDSYFGLCKARTEGRFKTGPVQCSWPAQANGYCRVHDPQRKLDILYRQEKRLAAQLEMAREKLEKFSREHPELFERSLRNTLRIKDAT